jgi:hypothetical protein
MHAWSAISLTPWFLSPQERLARPRFSVTNETAEHGGRSVFRLQGQTVASITNKLRMGISLSRMARRGYSGPARIHGK